MFYETFNEEELSNAMYESIENKDSTTNFKFQNEEDYIDATKALEERLFEDALYYIGNYYGIWGVELKYSCSSDLLKITIYWNYG